MVTHSYFVTNEWFYVLVVTALEAQAVYTWQFRKMPGAMMAIIAQIGKMIFLLSMVAASISTELSDKIFWITVQKITAVLLPNIWLIFTLQISQRKNSISPMLKYGLGGILCSLSLLLISNWHGLVWQKAWLEGQEALLIYGPGHGGVIAYSYLLGIITTILAVRWIVTSVGLRRRQALWYSFAVLISFFCHGVWWVSGGSIESIPWGFLINGAILTWIYYGWQFYNVLPLAQSVASRHAIEGLLIIDDEDYVVDINPAAKRMLDGLPVAVGSKFQTVRDAWPALDEAVDMHEFVEVVREHPTKGHCYYQLRRFPLQTSYKSLGRIISLYDITEQKRDQAQMLEHQKALSILTERNRLSRELHDTQGQFPCYVKTHTEAIRLLLQKGRVEDVARQLERLANAAVTAFDDVRESITGLKITAEDWDFFKNLQAWLRQFQQSSGIATIYTGPKSTPPQWVWPETEVQLLRIVQEALVNARKHSGASQVEIAFSIGNNRLTVTIADNGRGFDAAQIQNHSAGFGLKIIRERAEEISGTCKIRSVVDQGTVVTVEVPLMQMLGKSAI